jgi:hypothetical protein
MDNSGDPSRRTGYAPPDLDRPRGRGFLRTFMGGREVKMGLGFIAFSAVMGLAAVAAWVTHVMWVISKLAGDAGVTLGQIMLAILGTFVPPIGVLHGVMIWLGMGF